jgi:hypothetical protein
MKLSVVRREGPIALGRVLQGRVNCTDPSRGAEAA